MAFTVPSSAPAQVGFAVLAGLALGAITAYGQGWLGHSTGALVNSAGPWSLVAFVVARLQGRRVAWAIATAVVVLIMAEVGYVLANELRGYSSASSTVRFWLVAGVLAGPPLGVAASWSTRRGPWRPMGWTVIGGVLLGEGVYGWARLADPTDWRYWAVEVVIGAAVVVGSAINARRSRVAWAAVALGAVTALVVFAVSTNASL